MLRKNIFYNFLLSVSQILFPLITFPYSSRILGPSGIGSIVFVDSVTQIFLLFSALGIPIYGVREISKLKNNKASLDNLFSELITIHIICTLVFVIFYIVAAFVFSKLYIHLPLVIIGITILIFNIFSIEWFYQGIENFTYITKRTLLVRSSFILLLFVLITKKTDTTIYYALIAGSFFCNAVLNFNYSRKYAAFSVNNLHLRKHVRPLFIILCSNVVISVYLLMDNTIVGFLKGEIAVGYYSTAVKFTRVLLTVITSLGIVLIPQISRAHSEQDYGKINVLVNKSFNYVCTVGIPLFTIVIIFSNTIVDNLMGKSFGPSIMALQVISPIIFIIGLTNIFAWQILTPLGKDKQVLVIVIIGMVSNLGLNFFLIPRLSYLGAAIANVVTELIVMLCSLYCVLSLKLIRFDSRFFFWGCSGSIILILITTIIRKFLVETLLTDVLSGSICVIIYGCVQVFILKNDIFLSVLIATRKNFVNLTTKKTAELK